MTAGRDLGRDFLLIFASRIAVSLQGLIILPIVVRWAGVAAYGGYALVNATVSFILGLLLYAVSYRYQRKLASTSDLAERRNLFEPQFSFQLVAIAVLAAIVLARGTAVQEWLFAGDTEFTPWIMVLLLFTTMLQVQALNYFQYSLRFQRFSIASGTAPFLFVALVAGFAASGNKLSLDDLLAAQIAVNLCLVAALLPAMLREIGVPRLRLPFRTLIEDLRVGTPLVLEVIIDFVMRFSDRYLILLFLTVADVGRYQPAYTLASLVIFFIAMIDTVMIPTASRMIDEGGQAEAERALAQCLNLFLMLAVPFAMGALILGPTILGLLANPEVGVASRWVTPLVALGSIFYGVIRLASTAVFVLGHTRLILGASVLGAALNLALNIGLLPIFKDIIVPAATTMVGYAASCLYAVIATRRRWDFTIDWRALARYGAAAAAMAAVLLLLGFRPGVVAAITPLELAGTIAAGIFAYFAALKVLGGLGRHEFAEFLEFARRRPAGTAASADSPPATEA